MVATKAPGVSLATVDGEYDAVGLKPYEYWLINRPAGAKRVLSAGTLTKPSLFFFCSSPRNPFKPKRRTCRLPTSCLAFVARRSTRSRRVGPWAVGPSARCSRSSTTAPRRNAATGLGRALSICLRTCIPVLFSDPTGLCLETRHHPNSPLCLRPTKLAISLTSLVPGLWSLFGSFGRFWPRTSSRNLGPSQEVRSSSPAPTLRRRGARLQGGALGTGGGQQAPAGASAKKGWLKCEASARILLGKRA